MIGRESGRKAIRAVSFDVYGTLLCLHEPAERLRRVLLGRGLDVPLPVAQTAFRAEMGFYRDHHVEGSDANAVADLRRRCAQVLFESLAQQGHPLAAGAQERTRLLMAAVKFHLFPDVIPALEWCRARGLKAAITSNWDYLLDAVLRELGIRDYFCAITVSAVAGAVKPAAVLYRRTAELAGVEPAQVLHVGDEQANDVDAAQAAGMQAVLIDRDGVAGRGRVEASIETLDELDRLVSV